MAIQLRYLIKITIGYLGSTFQGGDLSRYLFVQVMKIGALI